MRKIIAAAAVTAALSVGVFAGPASAGKAHGKVIKDTCGASFGQLRQASPHPVTPSSGAANFATSDSGVAFHCPG